MIELKQWTSLGLVMLLIVSCQSRAVSLDVITVTPPSPANTASPTSTVIATPNETPFLYGGALPPTSGLIYNLETASSSYQRLWQVIENNEKVVTLYNGEDLSLSPDLQYGAYISNGDIWLIELNAGKQTNITNTPDCSERSYSEWSPDSKRFLFFSWCNDYATSDLYAVNLSSMHMQNLTNTTERNENNFIKWWDTQPDTIFFGSGIPEKTIPGAPLPGQCHTFLGKCSYFLSSIQADGTNYKVIDNVSGVQFPPALSPDGVTLAYDGGIIYNTETGIFKTLNPSNFGISPSTAINDDGLELVRPVWSPSGNQILWLGHVVNATDNQTAIYLFDLESKTGKILHRYDPYYYSLTLPPWQRWSDIEASWSPNEKYIAIISDEFHSSNSSLVLRIFDNKGNIIQKYEGTFNNLVWSPDSNFLTFGYFEQESKKLITLILDIENWQLHPLDIPENSKVINWVEIQ